MKKAVLVISILLAGVLLMIGINFLWVKTMNKPLISIKIVDEDNRMIIYNCLFYRVIECTDEEDNFTIVSHADKIPNNYCPKRIDIKYIDGYYVNSKGTKISEKDYALLYKYYAISEIDNMTSEDVKKNVLKINDLTKSG